MLPQTLDDLRRDGEVRAAGVDMTTPAMRKKSHLYQAAQVDFRAGCTHIWTESTLRY